MRRHALTAEQWARLAPLPHQSGRGPANQTWRIAASWAAFRDGLGRRVAGVTTEMRLARMWDAFERG